jgi:hypothetical protein
MKRTNKGQLHGWQGYLNCKRCNNQFYATSGARKYCDNCIVELTICPECGGKKSLYDKFCGNSCSGKWKYRNKPQVRTISENVKKRTSETFEKIAKYKRGKPRPELRAENNPNWKGGNIRYERHKDMGRIEYIQWRREIFKRNNFICQHCGQRGGKLNAHHIYLWKDYPKLRYDINNGITLCKDCHNKLHRTLNLKIA